MQNENLVSEKIIIINCGHTGISGDLLIGSLGSIVGIELTQNFLTQIIGKITPDKHCSIKLEKKSSNGILGYYLKIEMDKKENHQNHQHLQLSKEDHHSDYNELKEQLTVALTTYSFNDKAREFAFSIIDEIISVEAEIHGIPIDKVHLHEIGSIDTIIDVVGTTFLLYHLGFFNEKNSTKIYFDAIAVGGGTIKFSHGTLPVPAPATTKILEKNKLVSKYGPVDYELATPTGVAILGAIKRTGNGYQKVPDFPFQIEKQGIGVGNYQFENFPNILKTIYGLKTENYPSYLIPQTINVLETNIDDVRGEILGHLFQVLLQQKALDVSILPCTTKKNRPGYIIKVIANIEDTNQLVKTIIDETGTLGVRIATETRVCLERKIISKKVSIENQEFLVHIKQSIGPNGSISQEKVEFEDLLTISQKLNIPLRIVEEKIRLLFT